MTFAVKKLMTFGLLTASLTFTACQPKDGGSKSGGKAKLSTEEEKTYYAMGNTFGQRIEKTEPSASEMDAFIAGFRDAVDKKEPQVEVGKYQMKIGEIFRRRMKKRVDAEKGQGSKFLDSFVKSEGGTKTPSGLAYKIQDPGSGEKPKETDVVRVKYKGTLIDGTEFDSNNSATFPLNRVIRGWTEGLQLIGKGGKVKLVIPSDLAYGDVGSPPKIPGGSTLVFEIELFDIEKSDGKQGQAPADQ